LLGWAEQICHGELIEAAPVVVISSDHARLIDQTPLFDYYFRWRGEIHRRHRLHRLRARQSVQSRCRSECKQHWVDRAKLEADLASQLVSKLTSARSVPETAMAYQEWASRRMQVALEDGQHLFADNIKIVETAARFFSDGRAGTAA